jgi:hypothetical protein
MDDTAGEIGNVWNQEIFVEVLYFANVSILGGIRKVVGKVQRWNCHGCHDGRSLQLNGHAGGPVEKFRWRWRKATNGPGQVATI